MSGLIFTWTPTVLLEREIFRNKMSVYSHSSFNLQLDLPGEQSRPPGTLYFRTFIIPLLNFIVIIEAEPISISSHEPILCTCPHCGFRGTTETTKHPGMTTHLAAFFLLFLCLPCSILPYLTDCFQDTYHICPTCKNEIGVKKLKFWLKIFNKSKKQNQKLLTSYVFSWK